MANRSHRRRKIAERPANKEFCNCTVLRKAARRVSILYDRALDPAGPLRGGLRLLRGDLEEGPAERVRRSRRLRTP